MGLISWTQGKKVIINVLYFTFSALLALLINLFSWLSYLLPPTFLVPVSAGTGDYLCHRRGQQMESYKPGVITAASQVHMG